MEIDDADIDKTAFSSHQGLNCFVRMLYRHRSPPVTFERTTDVILSIVIWKFALAYLNDNVIFSKTSQKFVDYVYRVLSLLYSAGTILKFEK